MKKKVVLEKIAGVDNPSDLMTKYLSIKDVVKYLSSLNIQWIGRCLDKASTEGGVTRCSGTSRTKGE